MLNTLAIVKKMTAAGMPVQQAEAVAETLVDTLEGELASKRDVAEVTREVVQVDANLKRDIKELEANLKRDIKELEANLKRDVKELETALRRDLKELELKMEKLYSDTQRQTLQVGIGMAVLVITVLGFLFRFLAR